MGKGGDVHGPNKRIVLHFSSFNFIIISWTNNTL